MSDALATLTELASRVNQRREAEKTAYALFDNLDDNAPIYLVEDAVARIDEASRAVVRAETILATEAIRHLVGAAPVVTS